MRTHERRTSGMICLQVPGLKDELALPGDDKATGSDNVAQGVVRLHDSTPIMV